MATYEENYLLGCDTVQSAWHLLFPHCLAYSSTLNTGTVYSSETLEDIYMTTSLHILEDSSTLHTLAEVSEILEECTTIFRVKE
jgi:hypothetical protein